MKTKKEHTLFKVLTGSHLYGTASETSDFDYKAVTLPPLSDLLLNRKVTNRKEKPEGLKAGDKMVAGETETEYVPLQVFFDDFFSGQTYALELAFAAAQGLHVYDENAPAPEGMGPTAQWHFVRAVSGDLVSCFLTRDVKKMVGYAVSQSRMYGLKTERYTSVKAFVEQVERHFVETLGLKEHARKMMRKMRVSETPQLLAELKKLDHVVETTLANTKGGMADAPALDVCGKKFPMTNTWDTVLSSMEGTLASYGNRVASFEGEGVDWKAMSHAIRITEQVLELSTTGKLTFPRPNATFLKAVKMGQVPLAVATGYLEEVFARVDDAVENSILPGRTPELEEKFNEWKLQVFGTLYGVSSALA